MTALFRLFAAVEALIRQLVGLAARDGDREALLAEAIEALDRLAEAVTAVPELVEEAFLEAVAEVLPDGAPLPELTPEAEKAGRRLEERLAEATESARERVPEAIRSVTGETAEEAAQDATTGRVTRDGRRYPLGTYADAIARHELRRIEAEGKLAALPPGAEVKYSSHQSANPICRPLEGRVWEVDDPGLVVPPAHPNCGHRLEPVGTVSA